MINQSYSQGAQIWSVNYFLFFSVYLHMRQILLFFPLNFLKERDQGLGQGRKNRVKVRDYEIKGGLVGFGSGESRHWTSCWYGKHLHL